MKKRILVIDDDRAVRESFVLALEDTGYRVDTAESGERGLAALGVGAYDLIFLDLHMPGMNGVEVLRKIREANRKIPIYIITDFHKEFFNELEAARDDGIAFELLKKPLGGDRIVLLAKSVLEKPIGY